MPHCIASGNTMHNRGEYNQQQTAIVAIRQLLPFKHLSILPKQGGASGDGKHLLSEVMPHCIRKKTMPSKGEYNPTVRSTVKVLRAGFRQSIERVVMVAIHPCHQSLVTMPAGENSPRCQLPARLMLLMMHIN